MPHDRDGQELRVGDIVRVTCHVKKIEQSEDYCNLTLETSQPMHPGNQRSPVVLNAKQVVKDNGRLVPPHGSGP